ncbi:MAG: hypothetical protein ACE5LU_17690 [Anaerolineae bacterium]
MFADVTASLRMSTSPGGDEVTAVQSGTANVYAVVSYQDATQAELKVLVHEPSGVVVFEHSDIYNGSGERDIEITGRGVVAGYVSAALQESENLQVAVDDAQQSQSASAKRFRTTSAVTAVRTIDHILATLKRYPLPVETSEGLQLARDLTAEVERIGCTIIAEPAGCTDTTHVPDTELDAVLAELETQVTVTVTAVAQVLDAIDTDREWALPDGQGYVAQLFEVIRRSGGRKENRIKASAEWDVSPEGTPGTPVAPSPTATTEPTATLTPIATPEPTPTPTERPATATTQPTSVSAVRATSTPPPSPGQPTTEPAATTPPAAQRTVQTGPVTRPPTATSTVGGLTPTVEIEPPAQVPTDSAITEGQESYPAPPTLEDSDRGITPVVQAMPQGEIPPQADIEGQASGPPALEVARETPLAPQEVRQLPVVRIAAIVSALMLGTVALWLRARV